MVKCFRSIASCLLLLHCPLPGAAAAAPAQAEPASSLTAAEREKQALFLEAREANRIEARRLSSRGGAKRSKTPMAPHLPVFGGLFKKRKARTEPTEIAGMPPAPSVTTTSTPKAPAAPKPPTGSVASSKPAPPDPPAKISPAPAKSIPKIAAAPAPPKADPPKIAAAPAPPKADPPKADPPKADPPEIPPPPRPEPPPVAEAVPAASESPLLLPDVQVQPPAPSAGPSSGNYEDISVIAESRGEFQKGSLVYVGDAVMKAPAFRIESNRISVGVSSAGDRIEEARAVGSVSVQINPEGNRPLVSALSARAHFDPGKKTITLSGWPEYSIGDERRIATTPDTVIVLYLDGRVETEGETKLGLAGN